MLSSPSLLASRVARNFLTSSSRILCPLCCSRATLSSATLIFPDLSLSSSLKSLRRASENAIPLLVQWRTSTHSPKKCALVTGGRVQRRTQFHVKQHGWPIRIQHFRSLSPAS
uniref:Putative calcium-binding protein CML23 n=1 Tax=Schistocephalus solidus TaxID=70667 RepID=A0A0V0J3T3_SCHSO